MKKIEAHKHFWLGENHQHFPGQETIFKLSFPRVFIRYKVGNAFFVEFEEFYQSIAEVQWIDSEKPGKQEQMEILADAWNFLCIEERLLEEDMDDMDEFDEDYD